MLIRMTAACACGWAPSDITIDTDVGSSAALDRLRDFQTLISVHADKRHARATSFVCATTMTPEGDSDA